MIQQYISLIFVSSKLILLYIIDNNTIFNKNNEKLSDWILTFFFIHNYNERVKKVLINKNHLF